MHRTIVIRHHVEIVLVLLAQLSRYCSWWAVAVSCYLISSEVCPPLSVDNNLFQITSPKRLGRLSRRYAPWFTLFKVVQIVLVYCLSKGINIEVKNRNFNSFPLWNHMAQMSISLNFTLYNGPFYSLLTSFPWDQNLAHPGCDLLSVYEFYENCKSLL